MAGTPRIPRSALIVMAVAAAAAAAVLTVREATRRPPQTAEPGYRYSLEEFRSAPQELLRYERSADIPLELQSPRGVAYANEGRLLICGDRALIVLDPGGRVLERHELEAEPTCVAAGSGGRVYVGFRDHVEVFDLPEGRRRAWADLGGQALITSIAVDDGGVYVADAGNRMVLRFDHGGKLVGRIHGEFLIPSPYFDLAAAPDGTLWVVNPGRHRLERYSPQGRRLDAWGSASLELEGFAGCCNPTHLALLADGSFVTSEKGLPRVKVYDSRGALAAVVAPPREFREQESDLDLAVMGEGTIAVLVPGERRLRLYRPRGEDAGGSR